MRLLIYIISAFALLEVSAMAQTIKALGYNTTNGQVVCATNKLTLTNKLVFPSDANHGGLNQLALQISTNDTGFYVSTSSGNAMVAAHNGSAAYALTTNVIIFYKPLRYNSTSVGSTNAPTNSSSVARWIEVQVGTSSYRLPLYQ